MMKYLRLVAVQARISAAAGMAYRSDFLIEGMMAIAFAALTLLPLFVLYQGRQTVAGWDISSALIVFYISYSIS